MDESCRMRQDEGYGACEDAISISPFAIPLKRPKGLRPFWISQGATCSFLLSTKGAPIYVGYARRRVPRATDA